MHASSLTTMILHVLREAKPGRFQTKGFPTFSGKCPDCVADPFRTVLVGAVNRPRKKQGQIPPKNRETPGKIGEVIKGQKTSQMALEFWEVNFSRVHFSGGLFWWKKQSQKLRPKNSGPKFGRLKFVSQNSAQNSGSGGAKSPLPTFVPDKKGRTSPDREFPPFENPR